MRAPQVAAVFLSFLSSSVLVAQEPFTGVVNVTAIELSADVRDRDGNVPPDLQPSDFVVVENGIERTVTAIEYERAPRLNGVATSEVASADKTSSRNLVIYVDLELSNYTTTLEALRGLAKESTRLTSLGAISVVVTNPEVRWIVRDVTDAATLANALKGIEKLPAHDRLGEHRQSVIDGMQAHTRPGSPLLLRLSEMRSAIAAEEGIVARFHERMTRVIRSIPRGSTNTMFLVSDGFDLDPMEFYQEYLEDQFELINLRNMWSAKTSRLHDEFARSLSAAGWTITSFSGGVLADFRNAASESGHGKASAFNRNLPGTSSMLMGHRRDALLAITDATGGRLASAPPEFAKAIESMNDRVRITYQVPHAPDAKPRNVEVRVRRAGLTVRTSRWMSSSTPEVTASARAFEQFSGADDGELPIAARVQLADGQDRRKRATGSLEVRLGLDPLGALRQQLTRTTLRVTIAVESRNAPSNVMHQVIENYDLAKLQRVLFTAPLQLDPDVTRIAVVMEELSSGMWGGTFIALPAASRAKSFASAGWDETKAAIVAEDAPEESDGIAWMSWDEGLARAKAEQKLIFIRIDYPAICFGCASPNPRVFRHPAFKRHMESNFVPVKVDRNVAKSIDLTRYVGVADPWGRIRYSWEPKAPVELASLLTVLKQYAPSLIHAAAQLEKNKESAEAYFTIGYVYVQTEIERARDAYAKARAFAEHDQNIALLERIDTHLAVVDARTGHRDKAQPLLEHVIATTKSDLNAAEALLVLGQLHKAQGNAVAAADAFSRAAARAPKGSELEQAALALTGADTAPVIAGEDGAARLLKPVQLVRPRGAVITGRVQLQTLVRDARVDEVRFFFDDKPLETDRTPPFTARVQLEASPRPHTFRIQAFTRDGKVVGGDTLHVNERHDQLGVRIVSPRGGDVSGMTRVELDVQRPEQARLARVELYWNESRVATLRQPPYTTDVALPKSPGYVRAVAVLADGRTAEDAVTLNTGGYTQSIDVSVAELYARVVDAKGKPVTTLTKRDFTVLDDGVAQEIVRVEYVDRPPLLIGLALDTSGSMSEVIFELQGAAQEFLRNAFASDARSFLIAFDESPRLVNETTNDLPMLMSRIEEMRVQGGTTVLYDAIMFALLQFEGTSGKKALVVVSDGDDRSSRYTPREVAEFARRSGVAIYPIILNSRLENLRRVAAMAARTGGKAFAINNTRNLDVIYREIDAQLGGQYVITIAPKGEQKAGDVRNVDVRVATPNATVQATPGYEVR